MKFLIISSLILILVMFVVSAYQSPTFPLPQFMIDYEIRKLEELAANYIPPLNEYLLQNLININTATLEDFERLPGVGPVTAQSIFDYREKNGKFLSINQLLEVDRIGEKTLAKIRPYLTLGETIE